MGIKTDSGKMLAASYANYIEGRATSSKDIIQKLEFTDIQALNAVRFLKDKGFINAEFSIGGGFFIHKICPAGIHTIEDEPEFEKQFGFSVNLFIASFNWGAKEKKSH